MNILVTGANGFLGKEIVKYLNEKNYNVISLVRFKSKKLVTGKKKIIHNFKSENEWARALDEIDVVVHLIARTHITSERGSGNYTTYHNTNVNITETLCKSILNSSVKKLIFISSIKVNGENSISYPFSENSIEKPEDNYGITKQKAELVIQKIFKNNIKDYIIIRPPLIYGKNPNGNLKILLKFIQKKIPLPFKCIYNSRSIVNLSTLVKFITLCINEDTIKNELFLIADSEAYSTPKLIKKIAKDNNYVSKQFCIPKTILKILFKIFGRGDLIKKLLNDLHIDNSKAVFFTKKFGANNIFDKL